MDTTALLSLALAAGGVIASVAAAYGAMRAGFRALTQKVDDHRAESRAEIKTLSDKIDRHRDDTDDRLERITESVHECKVAVAEAVARIPLRRVGS